MNRILFALVVCVTLGACQNPTEPLVDAEARAQIEELKRQISLIKLEAALARIDSEGLASSSAVFDPQGSQSYTRIKAPTGNILVALDRIEPYLSGFNVFIRVGNPSTAVLHGVSGEIKWGKADDSDPPGKKFDLPDTFPPGSWRVVKLTTGPVDAQSMQKIVFVPVFNQLSLTRN